jgi:hypothetical protein
VKQGYWTPFQKPANGLHLNQANQQKLLICLIKTVFVSHVLKFRCITVTFMRNLPDVNGFVCVCVCRWFNIMCCPLMRFAAEIQYLIVAHWPEWKFVFMSLLKWWPQFTAFITCTFINNVYCSILHLGTQKKNCLAVVCFTFYSHTMYERSSFKTFAELGANVGIASCFH